MTHRNLSGALHRSIIEQLRDELAGQRLFVEPLPVGSVLCAGCNRSMPRSRKEGGGFHTHCVSCEVPRRPGESKQDYWLRVAERYKSKDHVRTKLTRRKDRKRPRKDDDPHGIMDPRLS